MQFWRLQPRAGETVNLQVIRLWNADGPRADEVVIERKHRTLYRLLVQNVVANNRRETAERPHRLIAGYLHTCYALHVGQCQSLDPKSFSLITRHVIRFLRYHEWQPIGSQCRVSSFDCMSVRTREHLYVV